MRHSLLSIAILLSFTACVTEEPVDGTDGPDLGQDQAALWELNPRERAVMIKKIRAGFARRGIAPIPTPVIPGTPERRAALIALGQALVFDKILSDNHDVSCMTCHPPSLGTDDDRTLSGGVRGSGLGFDRQGGVIIARNAPPLFNLHGQDALFWDGRVERLPDGRYRTPAGAQLTPQMTAVFEFGAASALGLFPVTSREEMREARLDGRFDDLTAVADGNFTGTWNALMTRLRAIPRYRELFGDAYPSWPGSRLARIDTMTFAHASNAMAAYFLAHFTSADSPWDRFVAGDNGAFAIVEQVTALSGPPVTENAILRGADIFLRECAMCHRGPFLSDNRFHNTMLAQIGPGVGDGLDGHDDYGRAHVTSGADPDARCGLPGANASCRYAFRTPSLRNVLVTGPYGHAGQMGHYGMKATFVETMRDGINDLRMFVLHYKFGMANNLRGYLIEQVDPVLRDTLQPNREEIIAHAEPALLEGTDFHVGAADIELLTSFLVAQTSVSILEKGLETDSPLKIAGCGTIPASVPSGLPIDGSPTDAGQCD
jgi:cytochrome c peroxidase